MLGSGRFRANGAVGYQSGYVISQPSTAESSDVGADHGSAQLGEGSCEAGDYDDGRKSIAPVSGVRERASGKPGVLFLSASHCIVA